MISEEQQRYACRQTVRYLLNLLDKGDNKLPDTLVDAAADDDKLVMSTRGKVVSYPKVEVTHFVYDLSEPIGSKSPDMYTFIVDGDNHTTLVLAETDNEPQRACDKCGGINQPTY